MKLKYSNNNLLSHTIGYLKKSDGTPQSGIEKSMNDVLNDNNSEYISVFKASTNSKGLDILEGSIETIRDNEDDEHLRLTIDSKIQKIIEEKGYMEGKSNGIFDPSANMSRAEFVTVLCRLSEDEYSGKGISLQISISGSERSDSCCRKYFMESNQQSIWYMVHQ